MISDAPINTPQVDQGGRPTIPWVGWFVAVAAALNSILSTAWKAWTATVIGSGSMTVTSSSITDAKYLRVGANVTFHCKATVTFGGTAATYGFINAPVTQVGDWQGITAYATSGGIPWQAILGLVQGGQIQFYAPNGGNWPVGASILVDLSGTYRCL